MTGLPRKGITLCFVRHGQTDWNAEQRLQGQMDIPLNDTGRAQAARNGAALKCLLHEARGYDFVASPMLRAQETMKIVRAQMGLPTRDFRLDERLKEISFGSWEGKTLAQVAAVDPAGHDARERDKWGWVPPGGESYEMLHARVAGWVADIAQDSLVVAHGGIMRVLRHHIEGLDPHEVPHLDAPQDQVLIYDDNGMRWL